MDLESELLDFITRHNVAVKDEFFATCWGCRLPIRERIVMKVKEQTWHPGCLKCCECRESLSTKCYVKDDGYYCPEDFFRKYGTRCAACQVGISPMECVRRARDLVYHLNCFVCFLCRRKLETGDKFYLMDSQKLLCKQDYDGLHRSGGTTKRPRTAISIAQLDALRAAYRSSSKPPRHVREKLAAETGLDIRVVQVWFQNRRAKEKRIRKDKRKVQWVADISRFSNPLWTPIFGEVDERSHQCRSILHGSIFCEVKTDGQSSCSACEADSGSDFVCYHHNLCQCAVKNSCEQTGQVQLQGETFLTDKCCLQSF